MEERTAQIVAHLETMERMAQEHGALEVARDLAGLRDRALAHRFQLLVLGQFKRGKSSVINALLGAPLLPTGVLPLTSVATRVGYGPSPAARVHLADGRTLEVPVERLAEWVTETHNPGNRKGVTRVEVDYPAPLLCDGLVLVDTPGIGSTVEENTAAAAAALPEADAALAVLGADPPLTQAELEYLRRAAEHAARIWFLQNKADLLAPDELQEVLAFNRSALAAALGRDDVEIRPVSARLALRARLEGDAARWEASGFAAVERELVRFLRGERAEAFAEALRRRALRLGERLRLALDVRRAALLLPAEALAARKARLEEQLAAIGSRRRVAVLAFRDRVADLVRDMEARLERFARDAGEALRDELLAWLRSARPLPHPRELDREAARRANQALLRWRDAERERLEGEFREAAARLAGELHRLREQLEEAFGELAGVARAPLAGEEGFTAAARFYLAASPPETVFVELSAAALSPFLPRGLALPLLERRLRQRVAEEVDRAAGAVRYDLAYRLQESARRFAAELEERLREAEAEMRRLLAAAEEQRQRAREEVAAAVAALDGARDELERLLLALQPAGG